MAEKEVEHYYCSCSVCNKKYRGPHLVPTPGAVKIVRELVIPSDVSVSCPDCGQFFISGSGSSAQNTPAQPQCQITAAAAAAAASGPGPQDSDSGLVPSIAKGFFATLIKPFQQKNQEFQSPSPPPSPHPPGRCPDCVPLPPTPPPPPESVSPYRQYEHHLRPCPSLTPSRTTFVSSMMSENQESDWSSFVGGSEIWGNGNQQQQWGNGSTTTGAWEERDPYCYKRKKDVVAEWIRKLPMEPLDPIDSLLTEDLSCDCKSGAKRRQEQIISQLLTRTSMNFLQMATALDHTTKVNSELAGLLKSTQESNGELLKELGLCLQNQQKIIEKISESQIPSKESTEIAELMLEIKQSIVGVKQKILRDHTVTNSLVLMNQCNS